VCVLACVHACMHAWLCVRVPVRVCARKQVFLRAQMTGKDVSTMHGLVTALLGGKARK
jgi:hypothetical protein